MIVFEIHCNFFIALPIGLKICRSKVCFFFTRQMCVPKKSGASQRFCEPSALYRNRARNFSRPVLCFPHTWSFGLFWSRDQSRCTNIWKWPRAIEKMTFWKEKLEKLFIIWWMKWIAFFWKWCQYSCYYWCQLSNGSVVIPYMRLEQLGYSA